MLIPLVKPGGSALERGRRGAGKIIYERLINVTDDR